jgi:uncharacterized protein (DUF1919 family)
MQFYLITIPSRCCFLESNYEKHRIKLGHIFLEKAKNKNNNNKIIRRILDNLSYNYKIFNSRKLKERERKKRQRIISS